MSSQSYLEQVLNQQTLKKESEEVKALREQRKNLTEIIKNSYKETPVSIQYAGSYKKGTMIKESYDLDITCYFNHDDTSAGETLEEIYRNVEEALSSEYSLVKKNSALRLNSKSNGENLDFHIDVVPGRFIDDEKEDVFLFQADGEKKCLKTNLAKHVSHIADSKKTGTIKLVKFWKERNALNIKTFVLELLVVKILGEKNDDDGLDSCLKKFWLEVGENIENISIEDPANPSGNDLSNIFNDQVKNSLSNAAKKTLSFVEKGEWEEIFGNLEPESEDKKRALLKEISSQGSNQVRPWHEK